MDFTTSENPMATYRVIETDEKGNKLYNHDSDVRFGLTKLKTVKIQCFPFYSLLLALNQTTIDYFSLDIEGHEKRILETIPWNKMVIKVNNALTFYTIQFFINNMSQLPFQNFM